MPLGLLEQPGQLELMAQQEPLELQELLAQPGLLALPESPEPLVQQELLARREQPG